MNLKNLLQGGRLFKKSPSKLLLQVNSFSSLMRTHIVKQDRIAKVCRKNEVI